MDFLRSKSYDNIKRVERSVYLSICLFVYLSNNLADIQTLFMHLVLWGTGIERKECVCVCVFECVSTLVQQILHATFFSTLPSFLATKSLRARFVPSLLAWFGFHRRGFESQYHSVDCKALLYQTFFC